MKHITHNLLTGTGLAALTFFLTTQTAAAGQCYTMPSCETMGYTETTCVDKTAIKCPFDTSKMKCVVTANPKSSCPEGYNRNNSYECVKNADIYYIRSGAPVVGGVSYGDLIFSSDASEKKTYEDAKDYCENLGTANASGQKIWRLPTQKELLDIPLTSIAQMKAVAELVGYSAFKDRRYWVKSPDDQVFCFRDFYYNVAYNKSTCSYGEKNNKHGVICVTTDKY